MLNGDYGRLRQMLMIFLHNSIKFSPEGSKIKLELTGNRLKLIDHGCGIKEEDIPHAFDRFYKARNEHNKSGSGLDWQLPSRLRSVMICSFSCRASWARVRRLLSLCRLS